MKFISLFSFLFIVQLLHGQTVDTLKLTDENQYVVIDSIKITGNETTEEFIILREMTITAGDEVNIKDISFNRERIYSLGLFNYVNSYLIREKETTTLQIDVYEKWYLYPFPFLFFNGGQFKNPTYGVNFRLENFRGRNETLNAYIALGYDPAVSLSYSNPALIFDADIGLGVSVGYQDFTNKSYNAEQIVGKEFEYTFYSGVVSLSKRIDQFNMFTLVPSYTYVETDVPVSKKITASSKSIDRVLGLSAEYSYDSRDLKQFPKSGLFSYLRLSHNGFGINGISYNILRFDFRQYNELIRDVTARWRMTYRNAFGKNVPYYNYSFFGYDEYVRGHRDDKTEGLQYFLGSFEMSYAIVNEWDLSLDLPLLPKRLTSTRIGVNFNIFADAGTTFNKFNELQFNSFSSGYGLGLNILFLPYNSIRFEYAFDEYMNEEFLIGLGFSF